MRVLSFQSKEVVNIILNKGEYKADIYLCREKRDYKLDTEQLNGNCPIWCFAPITGNEFTSSDFIDGVLLERFRCEMSLDQGVGLTKYYLLELEISNEELLTGKTHNAYTGAKVIPFIKFNQLKAIYRVEHTSHWYYKKIILIRSFSDDILFSKDFLPIKYLKENGHNCKLKLEHCEELIGNKAYAVNNGYLAECSVVSTLGDGHVVEFESGEIKEVDALFVKEINKMELFS